VAFLESTALDQQSLEAHYLASLLHLGFCKTRNFDSNSFIPPCKHAPVQYAALVNVSYRPSYRHRRPTCIQNVSGFYGPGSCIAWYLTLATSWVAVIKDDHSTNLHHIGYLLYANWAAIDVIRLSIQNSSNQLAANGPLGAALLVTWWRVAHATWQYVSAVSRIFPTPVADYRRRCRLLELGIFILLVAGIVVYIHLLHVRFDQISPTLYHPSLAVSCGYAHFYATLSSAVLFIVNLAGLAVRITAWFEARKLGYIDRSDIRISVLYLLFSLIPMFLVSMYVTALVLSHGRMGVVAKELFPHTLCAAEPVGLGSGVCSACWSHQ
jgi:hypothetical protein